MTEVVIDIIYVFGARTHFRNIGNLQGSIVVLKSSTHYGRSCADDVESATLEFLEKIHDRNYIT